MTVRLLVLAHGPTSGTCGMVFGDTSELLDPSLPDPDGRRIALCVCGPEPACQQTASRIGSQPARVLDELAGPQLGRWRDRPLTEVGATDPGGLRAWLADPAVTPHGGESLSRLVERVGRACDAYPWPAGASRVVVTPLVARALVVHALGASAQTIFRIDIAPLGRVTLSRSNRLWRLAVH